MSCSRLLALTLAVAFGATALSGCGRRGPLEAPLDATAPPAKTGVVDPVPDSNGPRPGLARDTSGQDALEREQVLAPRTAVTVPKTPFLLDPLL